jgi:hypothetical protein
MKRRWRDRQLSQHYSPGALAVIQLYNEICAPHGFFPVNSYSPALAEALDDVFLDLHGGCSVDDLEEFRSMFLEAVRERNAGDHIYNNPRGAKLIRILWNNY